MKKLIIRWTLKVLKKELRKLPNMSYAQLEAYGIEDVLTTVSGEKAIIL